MNSVALLVAGLNLSPVYGQRNYVALNVHSNYFHKFVKHNITIDWSERFDGGSSKSIDMQGVFSGLTVNTFALEMAVAACFPDEWTIIVGNPAPWCLEVCARNLEGLAIYINDGVVICAIMAPSYIRTHAVDLLLSLVQEKSDRWVTKVPCRYVKQSSDTGPDGIGFPTLIWTEEKLLMQV
jgi:hypothetical protein